MMTKEMVHAVEDAVRRRNAKLEEQARAWLAAGYKPEDLTVVEVVETGGACVRPKWMVGCHRFVDNRCVACGARVRDQKGPDEQCPNGGEWAKVLVHSRVHNYDLQSDFTYGGGGGLRVHQPAAVRPCVPGRRCGETQMSPEEAVAAVESNYNYHGPYTRHGLVGDILVNNAAPGDPPDRVRMTTAQLEAILAGAKFTVERLNGENWAVLVPDEPAPVPPSLWEKTTVPPPGIVLSRTPKPLRAVQEFTVTARYEPCLSRDPAHVSYNYQPVTADGPTSVSSCRDVVQDYHGWWRCGLCDKCHADGHKMPWYDRNDPTQLVAAAHELRLRFGEQVRAAAEAAQADEPTVVEQPE